MVTKVFWALLWCFYLVSRVLLFDHIWIRGCSVVAMVIQECSRVVMWSLGCSRVVMWSLGCSGGCYGVSIWFLECCYPSFSSTWK